MIASEERETYIKSGRDKKTDIIEPRKSKD
jgi:hypothetical protein